MANKKWTENEVYFLKTHLMPGTGAVERLAADLNELEAYRELGTVEELAAIVEERRWRKIGEEWPEDGQYCQLGYVGYAEGETVAFAGVNNEGVAMWVTCNHTEYLREKHGYTHWRPAPTDVPKEEG